MSLRDFKLWHTVSAFLMIASAVIIFAMVSSFSKLRMSPVVM